jgi:hypothetical protein
VFTPIAEMPGGWTLGYVVQYSQRYIYPEMPMFRYGSGILDTRLRTPFQVAHETCGKEIFYAVKKWLDVKDNEYGYAAQSRPDWRAVDKCKMALEIELKKIGEWDDALLDNGVNY